MLSRRGALAGFGAWALRGQNRRRGMFGDAEAYERFMGRWSRLLAPLLVDFTGLPERGRVLDAGSGTGALAFSIARSKEHCEVSGIDPSKEYVGFATSRNAFPDRVRFEVGDAQQMRFSDGTFQASLSLLVFNFIPDPAKALREIRRVTSAGGRVSAAVWDYGAGMRMLRMFWDAAVSVDPGGAKADESHMPLCRESELAELWKQSGLMEVAGRPLDITMRFGSFADYWEPFLLGQGPAGAWVRRMDAERRDDLRSAVKRRLGLQSENAAFSLAARAWAVRGVVPGKAGALR
ncbi:MAG TPA: class I SAM-dependent methyltransferase [Bryobacteraceae bacterium]|nr:class I SAM-dependent methyltransferase [Bryobacteraceae bacterium]